MRFLATILLFLLLSGCTDQKQGRIQKTIDELQFSASKNVLVVAHRGDWRNAPENSIPSITNCIKMGVDIVEVDVRKTKDNHFVLMHDLTIDRITNGSGKVSDFNLNELKQFYLKKNQGGPDVELTRERIPTLEEALLAAKGKIMLNLDKAYGYMADIYPLLVKTETLDHVILKGRVSADQASKDLSVLGSPVFFMPVLSDKQDSIFFKIENHLMAYQPVAFEFILSRSDSVMSYSKFLKERGCRIWVNSLWASQCLGHDDAKAVENPHENWGWIIDKGANIIQTDNPNELLNYLKSQGLRNF